MESIGTNTAWRRTPRLSSDAQFWLRIACVLPFSLAAWAVLLWWSFQELPIYLSQWVDKISGWTEAVTASAGTMLNAGKGDTNGMLPRLPDRPVSKPLSNYYPQPLPWQWRGMSETGWPWVRGNKDVLRRQVSARENKFWQNKEEDPFGVIRFLDLLRRSNGSSAAFVRPRSLFPITQHAVNGLRHGSGLPSAAHYDFAKVAPSHFDNPQTTTFVPLVQAALPKELELDLEAEVAD
nr:hypothetical protein [Gammaproteobacteria bacterium]